ncbi:hypothetical protein MO973_18055 [Paenibacillus sp. TRM 82003]|uniref:hypothetical protein n=1 Tax=Kineococcus sp. TRM81007 TaxID=2925831 RepID=UPI001F56019E|nr:hypothetical protein [Kineococcus sp. TRM81007]MCI2238354.1 hypothetical protein [Kineococcus sp. TRM81007]MCI3922134.1 hypothetical protein [Paenibacillus sp. TRM 82003]
MIERAEAEGVMSVSAVLSRVGLVLVHLGGVLALLAIWSDATLGPGEGANIGGALAVVAGAGLFIVGVLLEAGASITHVVSRGRDRRRGRVAAAR